MAAVLLFWHTNIAAVKSSLNVFKKLYWAVRYIACLADETKLLLSLSTKKRRNPCSGPSTCVHRFEYAPWLPCQKKKNKKKNKKTKTKTKQKNKTTTKKNIVDLPIRLKGIFSMHLREFVESSFLLNISAFSIQCSRINKQKNKQNDNVSSTPMIKTSRMLSVYLSINHKTVDNFARTSGNE